MLVRYEEHRYIMAPVTDAGDTLYPYTRSRPVFFAMADDPHVYVYVAATYLSQIFTVDGVH